MADPWSGSPYAGVSDYGNIFNQILQAGSGAGWNPTKTQTTLDQYGNDFVQQFQNAVGRAPTSDEINQFYTQAVNPIMNTQAGFASTDPNAVASQYVPQAFQSQIQQNQQAQLPNLGNQISNLATDVGTQTAKQLSDPLSSVYQMFSGAMNNMGIAPSSGAFQSGEGAAVGNAASNTMQQLLSSLGGGAIAGTQSPSLQNLIGTGMNAGASTTGYNQSLNDFNLQAQLAQSLGEMSQPSGIQKDIGMAAGAGQAVGGLGQGLGAASALTWICTQMRRCNVILDTEVKQLHDHLYRAFWKRPFKFLGYLLFGKLLVLMADKAGTNWFVWKSEFFDNVMAEPDPVKAVDLYEEAFWKLFHNVRSRQLSRKVSYGSR